MHKSHARIKTGILNRNRITHPPINSAAVIMSGVQRTRISRILGQGKIQREDGGTPSPDAEPAPTQPVGSGLSYTSPIFGQFGSPTLLNPDLQIQLDLLRLRYLQTLFNISPELISAVQLGDPNQLNFGLVPVTPPASAILAPLAPAPSGGGGSSGTPSVPGSFTPFSAGAFQFRIVFEQSSPSLPPEVQQREQRFQQLMTGEQPGVDYGAMIKGLIKNFLTQTPPGQAILNGITGAVGGGEDEPSGAPSFHLNLDVLPAPILEGQPPGLHLGVEVSF